MAEIEFTLGGKRYHLNRDEVAQKLASVQPGRVTTHAVEIGGVLHPVKTAFARVTGIDALDFTTYQARSVFQRLGFEVRRVS
jgi:hypothetical protein